MTCAFLLPSVIIKNPVRLGTMNRWRGCCSMKQFICVILTGYFFTGCIAQKGNWSGNTSVKEVEGNFPWFASGYDKYSPDSLTISQLKAQLPSYTILVFAGTWCEDTQVLLPQFYKSIDLAGFPRGKVDLYLLDKRKESPQKLEGEYKIIAVPVFIILKDNKEVGRIVESIEGSIEADLLNLIKK